MVKNLDLGAKLWLCARHRFLCNQPRWKNLWKKNSFQCSVLQFTKHCKLNWVFHVFILFSFFGMVYLMHILVLTVPVKAERLKCSEYNFAPQHIGAAGNLSCIAFGVGNKIWIASANILLSPSGWKFLPILHCWTLWWFVPATFLQFYFWCVLIKKKSWKETI